MERNIDLRNNFTLTDGHETILFARSDDMAIFHDLAYIRLKNRDTNTLSVLLRDSKGAGTWIPLRMQAGETIELRLPRPLNALTANQEWTVQFDSSDSYATSVVDILATAVKRKNG